jgi:hypothetical protein
MPLFDERDDEAWNVCAGNIQDFNSEKPFFELLWVFKAPSPEHRKSVGIEIIFESDDVPWVYWANLTLIFLFLD